MAEQATGSAESSIVMKWLNEGGMVALVGCLGYIAKKLWDKLQEKEAEAKAKEEAKEKTNQDMIDRLSAELKSSTEARIANAALLQSINEQLGKRKAKPKAKEDPSNPS